MWKWELLADKQYYKGGGSQGGLAHCCCVPACCSLAARSVWSTRSGTRQAATPICCYCTDSVRRCWGRGPCVWHEPTPLAACPDQVMVLFTRAQVVPNANECTGKLSARDWAPASLQPQAWRRVLTGAGCTCAVQVRNPATEAGCFSVPALRPRATSLALSDAGSERKCCKGHASRDFAGGCWACFVSRVLEKDTKRESRLPARQLTHPYIASCLLADSMLTHMQNMHQHLLQLSNRTQP